MSGSDPQWSYAQLGVSVGKPMTLGEYKQAIETGAYTRPVTDSRIGTTSSSRRAIGAIRSSLHETPARVTERGSRARSLQPAGRPDAPTSDLELPERAYRRAKSSRLSGTAERQSAGETASRTAGRAS